MANPQNIPKVSFVSTHYRNALGEMAAKPLLERCVPQRRHGVFTRFATKMILDSRFSFGTVLPFH